jgi:DNA-binding transcriptional LysR family regulator
VPRYGTPTRALFEKTFRDAGLPIPRNTVEASSLVAVRALLSESDRLTIISLSQINFERRAGFLKALPIRLAATARPIGTTVRNNTSSSPALSAFLKELDAVSTQMCGENSGMRRL